MRMFHSKWIISSILFALSLFTPAFGQYTGDITGSTTLVPGGVSRTTGSRVLDAAQATDFCSGSQLTGGTDATACLQAAVDSLCNRSSRAGGMLYIPAGAYRIDSTLNINCNGIEIAGAGVGDQMPPEQRLSRPI